MWPQTCVGGASVSWLPLLHNGANLRGCLGSPLPSVSAQTSDRLPDVAGDSASIEGGDGWQCPFDCWDASLCLLTWQCRWASSAAGRPSAAPRCAWLGGAAADCPRAPSPARASSS